MVHFQNFNFVKDAWKYALNFIEEHGNDVITKDNQLTREYLNMILEIKNPLGNFPFNGSWNIKKLDEYAKQLCEFSYDCKGFDYTYNERMGRQVYYIINELKKYSTTRRATIYLWIPEKDLENNLHKPCQIIADYKIRNSKLYATHIFRSHDMKDAYPQNVYGLAKLQKQIADECNIQTGSLITHSISAHFYKV